MKTTTHDPSGTAAADAPGAPSASGRRRPTGRARWLVLAHRTGEHGADPETTGEGREQAWLASRAGCVEVPPLPADTAAPGVVRTPGGRPGAGGAAGGKPDAWPAGPGPVRGSDPRRLVDLAQPIVARHRARACAVLLSVRGPEAEMPGWMRQAGTPGAHPAVVLPPPPAPGLFPAARAHAEAMRALSGRIAMDPDVVHWMDADALGTFVVLMLLVRDRTLDLLALDGGLMPMLEVAWQIHGLGVLVASEDRAPFGAGLPGVIVPALARRPSMSRAELAALVVREARAACAGTGGEAVYSAVDLGQLEPVVDAVDRLAGTLLGHLASPGLDLAIAAARRSCVSYLGGSSVDLHDFARTLAIATDLDVVRRACGEVMVAIDGDGARGPIVATGRVGARLRSAGGLSIYFPRYWPAAAQYRELAFARRTRWVSVLDAVQRRRPAPLEP